MAKAKSKKTLIEFPSFLLSSKLSPPVIRTQLVERQVLLDSLVSGDFPLTLIVAGAGFGKTSLLSQWYAVEKKAHHKVAWLSLDANDSDPVNFISYLIAALNNVGFDLEHLNADRGYGSQSSRVQRLLSVLCRELENLSDNVLLILDDYHNVQSEAVDQVVDFLLARLPSGFRVVLSTRTRPSIALPTLLAQGKLLLVDDSQLRFSQAESRELFGDLLDDQGHQEVLARTNGWGFALQMARILVNDKQREGGESQSFTGASENIAHYLSDQVLSTLEPEAQAFLVDTSFLNSVCGELADAVRNTDDSSDVLEALQPIQASFVLHDTGNLWYRYHPLFAEFLQDLLAKKGEAYLVVLRQRAANWYARHNMLLEAVRQATLAEDIALTAKIIDEAGGTTIMQTRGISVFGNIMGLIPGPWVHQVPMLTLGKAALLARDGKAEEAAHYIEEVKRNYSGDLADSLTRDVLFVATLWTGYADAELTPQLINDLEPFAFSHVASDPWLRGWLYNALFLNHYRIGNFAKAISAADLAMAHYLDYGALYSQFFMHLNLGMTKFVRGEIVGAFRSYTRAVRLIERHFAANRTILAVPHLLRAAVFYQVNRLEQAGALVQSALAEVERGEGWPEPYILGYQVAVNMAYHDKGLGEARHVLDQADKTANTRNLPRLKWHTAAKRVELYCFAGQLKKAEQLASEEKLQELLGRPVAGFAWSERQAITLALSRLALYSDDSKRALQLLKNCNVNGETDQLVPFRLRKLLLEIMAYTESDDAHAALNRLEQLIALKAEKLFIRTFLDEGQRLVNCLKYLVQKHQLTDLPETAFTFIKQLSDMLKQDAKLDSDEKRQPFEKLTRREQQILKELADGHSNKVIARKLEMSERTVRFHLQNIYAKFGVQGVNSRTQVIDIAHRYDLL